MGILAGLVGEGVVRRIWVRICEAGVGFGEDLRGDLWRIWRSFVGGLWKPENFSIGCEFFLAV